MKALFRQLSYGSRNHRFVALGACHGGKTEGQAVQVLCGTDRRLSAFFHGTKQLAHSPAETVRKPAPLQCRRGRTIRRDYYRVETPTGQRFWLFRQLDESQWFLHGVFE